MLECNRNSCTYTHPIANAFDQHCLTSFGLPPSFTGNTLVWFLNRLWCSFHWNTLNLTLYFYCFYSIKAFSSVIKALIAHKCMLNPSLPALTHQLQLSNQKILSFFCLIKTQAKLVMLYLTHSTQSVFLIIRTSFSLHKVLCVSGAPFYFICALDWITMPFFSLSISRLPPSPTICPGQAEIAVDWKRLSPCGTVGVLMNLGGLLNEDLLKCCRLVLWHFRASGGVLNRCLCKCHSLTLWNGWPYE